MLLDDLSGIYVGTLAEYADCQFSVLHYTQDQNDLVAETESFALWTC